MIWVIGRTTGRGGRVGLTVVRSEGIGEFSTFVLPFPDNFSYLLPPFSNRFSWALNPAIIARMKGEILEYFNSMNLQVMSESESDSDSEDSD